MKEERKVIGGFLYVCYECGAIIESKIYEGDNKKMRDMIMDKHVEAMSSHRENYCKNG